MNASSKPRLERIEPGFGSSFSYRTHDKKNVGSKQTFWHYHPEIELVYVNGGCGKRQIGSHISYYRNGDLLLIGSLLPHCAFTDGLTNHNCETVIQFKDDFLGQEFLKTPEMGRIQNLLERAKKGIVFHGDSKRSIGADVESLQGLDPFQKLLGLLQVLNALENTKDYTILNAEGFLLETNLQDNDRLNTIFNYVKVHFQRPISLEEISNMVSMTNPAFCRYFKRITGKTFTQFVNEYRLAHAAKLLHERQMSITDVCFESGFNNFSHFNKQFKSFTGRSPSLYRRELKFSIT
ncbi:AraC family transcriptional regulator [Christiangramia portivictoriae]|uniref:AraC family transcriptional regulator n=1 Tax=Christiangramia portivictoriae TaxID=326069 RepID=UPI000427A191|nr:AraC family transcriptional regulator [Christiangramia portivictoriae]